MTTLRIRLEVEPGDVAVNQRLIPQYDRSGKPTGRLVKSSRYRSGLGYMALQVRQAVARHGWRQRKGQVRVEIVTHWPGKDGDCDATCKAVVDALADGLAVVNDRQCRPILLDCDHNNRTGSIDVELVEVE